MSFSDVRRIKQRIPYLVRLVDKNVVNKVKGRLEVFADGKWGTVCDDHDGTNDHVSVLR